LNRSRSTKRALLVLSATLGLGCWAVAQSLLLAAREPVRPLMLYMLGFLMLWPAFMAISRSAPDRYLRKLNKTPLSSINMLLWALALDLTALAMLVAGVNAAKIMQLTAWSLALVVTILAAFGGERLAQIKLISKVETSRVLPLYKMFLVSVMLAVLMLVAVLLQAQTTSPALPMPEHTAQMTSARAAARGLTPYSYPEGGILHFALINAMAGAVPDLASLQRLSAIFAVLIVPTMYLFGRAVEGKLTGFCAAGFAAVGLWPLAIGKGGDVFTGLAAASALYLAALVWMQHTQRRSAVIVTGLALGGGWLLSPLFVFMALLLPIKDVLSAVSRQPSAKDRSENAEAHSVKSVLSVLSVHLSNSFAVLVVAGAVALPILVQQPRLFPLQIVSANYQERTGLSPTSTAADAVISSLLLFNLTSDPTALHGIVNRPVFEPVTAAAFLVGILAWVRCINFRRHAVGWLLMAALVIAMLPAVLLIEPPLRYPDLRHAAMALPVGFVFAAYGMAMIGRLWYRAWGKMGRLITAGLFLLVLGIIALDARQHYTQVFLPTYARAALVYVEMHGG
jgi:hypothetical protein